MIQFPSKTVDVYRNITSNIWSVRSRGLVIFHSSAIFLENVKFVTYLSTIKKVRSTKKKTPCAFVRGELVLLNEDVDINGVNPDEWAKITFNPNFDDYFCVDLGRQKVPIFRARECLMIYPYVYVRKE